MQEGMFGRRLAQHFSLPTTSTLVLKPATSMQVALTRLTLPHGFPGPTPRIPPEKAFAVAVHLRRPGAVKGWGSWIDNKFHAVSHWDLGGIEIFDMEADPIGLRSSGFDSVHIHIPRTTLDSYTDSRNLPRVAGLLCHRGERDDVLLHWTQAMLPYFNRAIHLPQLVLDELVHMFCARLVEKYQDKKPIYDVVTGGLATWQQERAIALLHERLDGELSLAELSQECGLSSSHFARAFKRTFQVPVHRYLLRMRLDLSRTLLLHSEKSLLEIALEAGFSDQPAFNRAFRAFLGTSPGQWRRQNKSQPAMSRLRNSPKLVN